MQGFHNTAVRFALTFLCRVSNGNNAALRRCFSLSMQPAGSWYPGQQIVHLIGQDMPVSQDEVFMPGWRIRHIQQRHARLLRRALGLFAVAGPQAVTTFIHACLPQKLTRDELLMKLGAAKKEAGRAYAMRLDSCRLAWPRLEVYKKYQ